MMISIPTFPALDEVIQVLLTVDTFTGQAISHSGYLPL
jgi:hypothetical protein